MIVIQEAVLKMVSRHADDGGSGKLFGDAIGPSSIVIKHNRKLFRFASNNLGFRDPCLIS
jgi:hypothetical protein